jgi:hypothetical protein
MTIKVAKLSKETDFKSCKPIDYSRSNLAYKMTVVMHDGWKNLPNFNEDKDALEASTEFVENLCSLAELKAGSSNIVITLYDAPEPSTKPNIFGKLVLQPKDKYNIEHKQTVSLILSNFITARQVHKQKLNDLAAMK